jgi:hypothetical protein
LKGFLSYYYFTSHGLPVKVDSVIPATSFTHDCIFSNQFFENISFSKSSKELSSFGDSVFTFTEKFFNFDKSSFHNSDTFEFDIKSLKSSFSSLFKVSLFLNLIKSHSK